MREAAVSMHLIKKQNTLHLYDKRKDSNFYFKVDNMNNKETQEIHSKDKFTDSTKRV
jgi:hypothetical protein